MSAAPWKTTRDTQPYGFRITIERRHKGNRENHTFKAKTRQRAIAVKQAEYKDGFIRLVECVALTQAEWEKEFGNLTRSSQRATEGAAR